MIADRDSAEHYVWGAGCDGWVLRGGEDLSIIEERMPPGTREERHLHHGAEQFFYVLTGTLTLEVAGVAHRLTARQGMAVGKGVAHQARNDGDTEVFFLVISAPTSRGDRQRVKEGPSGEESSQHRFWGA